MQVFFSESHRRHAPPHEFTGGALIPAFDSAERADRIAESLRAAVGFDFAEPADQGRDPILAVHSEPYLAFLQSAVDDWRAAGFDGPAMATTLPIGGRGREPSHIEGRIGYYALSCETCIAEGSWEAAYQSAQCAVNAADAVMDGGARAAFALCRPPGHHCEGRRMGGYCYLNNAAIAAERLRARGAARVGVLDIDFHHGNGTQAVFWDRADVVFASVHGDPNLCFPFYYGYADETGEGAGEGATLNRPLPPGATTREWLATVEELLAALTGFNVDALVLSLGADAHVSDPQGFFEVEDAGFVAVGEMLRASGLPVAAIMEGGYSLPAIGPAVRDLLTALDGR